MKRLLHNLTSNYLEAAGRLRPAGSRQRIVAYVESFDDIAFWRTILDEFEDDKLYFEIKLPSRTSLSKGKRIALTNVLSSSQLGKSLIACVDADYDWLMGDVTESSRLINNSPYVIHTYVYAIENYHCYAPSLHHAVVSSTLNDRPTIDFVEFFKAYSTIVWPLFVWNIWCYRYDHYRAFSMADLATFISIDRAVNISHPEYTLERVRHRVNQKIAWLQRHYPQGRKTYQPLRNELLQKGLTPETTYLYIQGHTLFENVVLPLLDPICIMLRKEREREIRQLACHSTQRQNELSSYQHSQLPIDIVLRKNTEFRNAPQMQWVRQKIRQFIEMTNERPTPDPPRQGGQGCCGEMRNKVNALETSSLQM